MNKLIKESFQEVHSIISNHVSSLRTCEKALHALEIIEGWIEITDDELKEKRPEVVSLLIEHEYDSSGHSEAVVEAFICKKAARKARAFAKANNRCENTQFTLEHDVDLSWNTSEEENPEIALYAEVDI